MADLATLSIAVDSRPVAKASADLDGLTASAGRTGSSVDRLIAANQRMAAALVTSSKPLIDATRYLTNMQLELEKVGKSSLQIKAMEIKMAAAAAPTAALAAEIRKTGAELIRAERNATIFAGAGQGITNSAGQQRAGMQQLSFQIQDVAQQFALGTSPMVIFAQQSGQVISAMSMMTNSTKGFLGFLAGPWGAALTAAAMVMMPLISRLFDTEEALSKVELASNNLSDVQNMMSPIFDTATGKMRVQSEAALALARAQIILARATSQANAAQARSQVASATEAKFQIGGGMGGGLFLGRRRGAEALTAENVLLGEMKPSDAIQELQLLEKQGKITRDRLVQLSSAIATMAVEQENLTNLTKAETSLRDGVLVPGLRRETKARVEKNKVDKEAIENARRYAEALQDVAMQMGGVNLLIPSEGVSDILDAQAKVLNENRAKDAAALQSNIDFATNAAAEIGTLIGGTFGQGVKDLAELINRDFPKLFGDLGSAFKGIAGAIDGVLGKLGTSLKTLGQGAAIGSIGASLTGGSQTGGAIGGAIGGSIGSAIAGPIGQIAGSILGGIVGGLFKKTKQASATIASIGGQAVVSTITGNNAELKGVANSMATGLLKGIASIAEQLGGTLGGAVKLSIGQRNKDFVVDPTGAGRTKGAGVINFGQDQAAAVAYVTQLAIQQGIITGISAGAQTLIKAGGDLNDQVQKALKFDQVFKDLRSESDPLGASLDALAAEMMKLKAIFAEAGASAEDYAKLEELFAIKQAKVTFEANRPLRELEIQLMEAQGRAAAALAARRQLELEAMDESQRALQQQIWAAEDAAKAAQEMAEASARSAEEAAALAANRARLEIALMDAQGNAAAALAARRELELEGMDANLRALQRQIWAAEDAAKANEELAAAQAKAAEEAKAAAEAASALALERRNLEIDLMEALGKSSEALAARRQLELNSIDASLRGLKEQIWAAQDKAIQDAAAAKAAEEAAAAQAKAAEEAANAAQRYQDALSGVTDTIRGEINRLRGITDGGSSAALKAQFALVTAQARSGNLEALGKLPELSKSIEQAAIASANSALDVSRIRAWLASSLSDTLSTQPGSDTSVSTSGAGLVFDGNKAAASNAGVQTADNINVLRFEMQNALYQIAKNTGKSTDIMNRWDGDGIPDFRDFVSNTY